MELCPWSVLAPLPGETSVTESRCDVPPPERASVPALEFLVLAPQLLMGLEPESP